MVEQLLILMLVGILAGILGALLGLGGGIIVTPVLTVLMATRFNTPLPPRWWS